MRLDDETKKLLKTVVDHWDAEDRATRERQVRHYRRQKLYWNNFSRIYYSEVAHDYRLADMADNFDDQAYYDRPVNVYRAFLETIIAALSIQIPAISCVPDDADNPIDLSTAKAGDKMAELIYKHNDVIFLWLQALYVYCTEGMIACYTYAKDDKAYGMYNKRNYKDEEVEAVICPDCGEAIPDDLIPTAEERMVNADAELPPEEEALALDTVACPNCGAEVDVNTPKAKLTIPRFVGVTKEPKSRICMEVYGGLYVKVANYAKKQADTPYLIWSYETHYANALEWYPILREDMPKPNPSAISSGSYDIYEQTARLNPQYLGDIPEGNLTIRNAWLRHAAFNILEEDDAKKMKKKFPDGAMVVLVGDKCAEYRNEELDKHWTLSHNPMSDFLTHDPLGELVTNIQDIVNDLISLTLQTIEHGITETWADPAVVNFEGIRQRESMPGTYTPTKTVSANKNISEAFWQTQAASLSPEIFNFYRIIQELGQFVSGALPSLFGGAQTSGSSSRTASEYAMSKGMAMQRLQTPWKMMTIWWKNIFGKAIPMYMEEIKEDERFVEKDVNGNFINVFIRKSELDGKIGNVELEASDKLPITDEQKADWLMQLFQLNNQEILAAFTSPENLPFVRKIVKIPEFKLPGEDDRTKQYEEISQLVASTPISLPPDVEVLMNVPEGQEPPPPMELPSVEVDPVVDNHEIEAAICRSWLVSAAGRLAKQENPDGYKNVLLHMKAHMDIVMEQMAAEQSMAPQEETSAGGKKPAEKPPSNKGKVKEDGSNVPIQ